MDLLSAPFHNSAPGGLDAGSYFDTFLNWNGDGRGAIRDLFDAYAVHAYTYECLDRTSPSAVNSNFKALAIVDYTAAATTKPIYLTEMGVNLGAINNNRGLRVMQGQRYVTALRHLSGPGNQVRGAMAFVQDPVNPNFVSQYGIDADGSGNWFTDFPQANAMGGRQVETFCNGRAR